ncbi:MAG: hypothetical protein WDN49_01825 [Acetobacteraceae bacterium]
MKKTSAGEELPSLMSWLASSGASPSRTVTVMPVCLVKALVSMSTVCSCCAEYSVSDAARAAGAAKVSATIPAAMPSRPNAALRWRSAWV